MRHHVGRREGGDAMLRVAPPGGRPGAASGGGQPGVTSRMTPNARATRSSPEARSAPRRWLQRRGGLLPRPRRAPRRRAGRFAGAVALLAVRNCSEAFNLQRAPGACCRSAIHTAEVTPCCAPHGHPSPATAPAVLVRVQRDLVRRRPCRNSTRLHAAGSRPDRGGADVRGGGDRHSRDGDPQVQAIRCSRAGAFLTELIPRPKGRTRADAPPSSPN